MTRSPFAGRVLMAVLFLAGISEFARADVVITKDGFAIHGKVFKEAAFIDNPNGFAVPTTKVGGFTMCDDGARLTIFSPNYRQVGDLRDNFDRFSDFLSFKGKTFGGARQPFPLNVNWEEKGNFDEAWLRTIRLTETGNPKRYYDLKQQIETLTPYYCRMISTTHNWSASYLTKELGSPLILDTLRKHPDLKEEAGKPDLDKRRKIIRFLIQAEWYTEAEAEIAALSKALPDAKDKVAEIKAELRSTYADKTLEQAEIALKAGRHDWLKTNLATFPKEGISATITQRFVTFKAEYDALIQRHDKANEHLIKLVKVKLGNGEEFLNEAGKMVLKELHPEGAVRLDTFVTLAEQVERDVKQGRATSYTPAELLSAALSGWLLGKTSAETKVENAKKLWESRNQLMDYLKDDNRQTRQGKLPALEERMKKGDLPPIDELAQLIVNLPPPFENKDFSTSFKQYNTGSLPGNPKGVDFVLQLPPEHHFARRTPLLVLLPDGGEKAEDLVKKFGDLPAKHGYIVVVPVWNAGFKTTYQFEDAERATVPAVITHLQRFLQIDADKVFLFGANQAGNMAYDVALSHPDLFAGVALMCPNPNSGIIPPFKASPSRLVLFQYWQNAAQLPIYWVMGDRSPKDTTLYVQTTLKNWMPRGYPALGVAYKGRTPGWYFEELPFIFDWMSRKKRANGLPEAGRSPGLGVEGGELRTMRNDDNHFYWLRTSEIKPELTLERNPKGEFTPARIYGKMREGNVLYVKTAGIGQLTVMIPRGTLELDKPYKIILNDREAKKDILKPNLKVMLEEAYESGERQRLYVEKVEFKGAPYLPTK